MGFAIIEMKPVCRECGRRQHQALVTVPGEWQHRRCFMVSYGIDGVSVSHAALTFDVSATVEREAQ